MTKIRELNNEQLLESIKKYQKIIDGLHKERTNRIGEDPQLKSVLMTPEEIAQEEEALALAQAQEQEREGVQAEKPMAIEMDDGVPSAPPPPQEEAEATPPAPAAQEQEGNGNVFQLELKDEDLKHSGEVNETSNLEEEEQVRVTKLLSLSEEELNEFHKKKATKEKGTRDSVKEVLKKAK